MFFIDEPVQYILTEKKSKFITRIVPINSESDFDNILTKIVKEEKGATHNCFAYRILDGSNVTERKNDDGEPGSTAGAPMLAVLVGNDLVNVCAVTTRYFGGIKLGTGGLCAAYKKGVVEAIKLAVLKELVLTEKWNLNFEYNQTKYVDYILDKLKVKSPLKTFTENVAYKVNLTADQLNELSKMTENHPIRLTKSED